MPKPLENTLFLEDVPRLTGPLVFQPMIKPIGSTCNLDCAYCYYLDKADIYGGKEPKMSEEMLREVIRTSIQANQGEEVTFNWHGGEPLLAGLDFFRKAVALEREYADGKIIHNTLQTNGTLLDDAWAGFFARHEFLVGLSLDGPQDIHDCYRRDKGGAPTFDRVIAAAGRLHRAGAEFNTLSTVNKRSEGRGREVYRFLTGLGSRFLQLLPVVEHVRYPLQPNGRPDFAARPHIVSPDTPDAVLAKWSVSAMGFGKFLCEVFDEWVCSDVGRVFVGQFDATLARYVGTMPGICAYGPTCGGCVIEHNGDVYSCDHFVYPEYRLGNVTTDDLAGMMTSDRHIRFGLRKRGDLPRKCLRCPYLSLCTGECPQHRFNRTESGETGLSALCEGYQAFFRHTEPYFVRMRELLAEKKAPALVVPWARARLGKQS